jgi:hypothetical protein
MIADISGRQICKVISVNIYRLDANMKRRGELLGAKRRAAP